MFSVECPRCTANTVAKTQSIELGLDVLILPFRCPQVPGRRAPQMLRKLSHRLDHRCSHPVRGDLVVGQVQRDRRRRVPRSTNCDRRSVSRSSRSDRPPHARDGSGVGFTRTITDRKDLLRVVDAGPPRIAVRDRPAASLTSALSGIGTSRLPHIFTYRRSLQRLIADLIKLSSEFSFDDVFRDRCSDSIPSPIPLADPGALRMRRCGFDHFGRPAFNVALACAVEDVIVTIEHVPIPGSLAPDSRSDRASASTRSAHDSEQHRGRASSRYIQRDLDDATSPSSVTDQRAVPQPARPPLWQGARAPASFTASRPARTRRTRSLRGLRHRRTQTVNRGLHH